ncbi:universal stress protein [Sedimentibacter hydroxybenzoicus DSM 7310]|uniref:Universal stress protein n=2 Tax=Tissierellia incertae sedis TaxID=1737407 RepID=A0A974BJ49_SEDHY|nr:universal stress protein [Sedimentibacter hydroxybenzoicus DSM 7310]HCX62039.1 universal stress protein UspA [Clostridiales bacterium]
MVMHKNVLVCVTQQKTCEKLIEQGVKLTQEKDDNLYVIHVVNENDKFLNNFSDGEALEYLFMITKNVGAELVVKRSKDVIKSIVEYAEEMEITHVVLGSSRAKDPSNNFVTKLRKGLPDREFVL